MKLTSKGRYAVMALVDIAKFDNINPVSLRDISLRQGISVDFLEQIFSKLKKNEIVKSIRGTQGGFSTFVISYYAMGLLEIMLEAGIAAKLLEVNPKIVLGVAAPIVFFSVWALTRWTRKRVTRTPK